MLFVETTYAVSDAFAMLQSILQSVEYAVTEASLYPSGISTVRLRLEAFSPDMLTFSATTRLVNSLLNEAISENYLSIYFIKTEISYNCLR